MAGLTSGTKGEKNERGTSAVVHNGLTERITAMVRLARESLAFASVASFVWMVCSVAGLRG
jgi:hypothetical protein